jgi:hypothetical protein
MVMPRLVMHVCFIQLSMRSGARSELARQVFGSGGGACAEYPYVFVKPA